MGYPGSPATIVSLVDLLAAERRPHQTPEEWEKATLQKFSPPEVSLTGYPLSAPTTPFTGQVHGRRSGVGTERSI